MDVNNFSLLGISVVVLAALLLTCVEQVTSEAGQPGEACLSTGLCLNKNMTCEHKTCKIKKDKSCLGADKQDHCVKGLSCIVTCPCCQDQGIVCGKGPGLLKSCTYSALMAFVSWLGAILITGACFYLVLEVCG